MKGVLIGLGLVVLLLVTVVAGWAWRYYTAEVRGKVGAAEQIESASSRIVNYNYFFDLCANVQFNESALEAQYEQLSLADENKERVLSNIAGLKAQRMRNIFQYNVDAQKDYTIAQFRDSKLPYQLNDNEYKKGVRTEC